MEELLNLLLLERGKLANAALMHPSERSEFEYGRVSGQYQGLTKAIEAVNSILADRDEDE